MFHELRRAVGGLWRGSGLERTVAEKQVPGLDPPSWSNQAGVFFLSDGEVADLFEEPAISDTLKRRWPQVRALYVLFRLVMVRGGSFLSGEFGGSDSAK
jgi:hypothetical protein